MQGFRHFIEMFLNQKTFYLAINDELQPGQEITAGSHSSRGLDGMGKAIEDLYDRVRQTIDPELPSRIGALFVSRNLEDGHRWKSLLRKKWLYEVELLSGKPYLTDGDIFGDSLNSISRPVNFNYIKNTNDYYNNLSKGSSNNKDEFSTYRVGGEYDAMSYWRSGNRNWHPGGYHSPNEEPFSDSDIEFPEVILAKGSKLRVVRRVD